MDRSRNATVALLPGIALLVWSRQPAWPPARRLWTVGAVIGGALVPWVAARAWLGQLQAHAPGRGAHGVFGYTRQALDGLAYGLGPERWGIGIALLAATALGFAWEAIRPAPPPSVPPASLGRSRVAALVAFAVLFAVLAVAVAVLALARQRPALLALGAVLASVPTYPWILHR